MRTYKEIVKNYILIYEKHITKELYNEMVYTLLFRDVSKEALSLIVELLAHCVIEGIEDYKRGNSATD